MMSTQSAIKTEPDLIEVPMEDISQLKVKENVAASAEIDELSKGEAVNLKLVPKKHKRKMSPQNENEIPEKVKKEADIKIDTECLTVKTRKSDKHNKNKLTVSSSDKCKKRSHCDLDDSFQSSSKKAKTSAGILNQEEVKKKLVRRRMKHLLQTVVDQMEFYFGDSNLSKDRYLRKLIDNTPDGYVDLSVFGNFNKLQSLHKDGVSMKVLASAIKKSKLLQLNDDGTKVRRVTPINVISQEEINSRTIYVEHLPVHANHMWIRSIFCQCGKVVYVSLPVYKTTRMIKGFAFVEFDTPEEAAKACMLLNNPLPAKSEEKPGKFPKGNKTLNKLQKIAPLTFEQDSNEENSQSTESKETSALAVNKKKKKKNKRRRTHDSTSDDGSMKPNITEAKTVDTKNENIEGKKKKKKKKKKQVQDEKSSIDIENKSNTGSAGLTSPIKLCTTEATDFSSSRIEDVHEDTNTAENGLLEHKDGEVISEGEKTEVAKNPLEEGDHKKKKNKKKRKGDKKQQDKNKEKSIIQSEIEDTVACDLETVKNITEEFPEKIEVKLGRKERKRLRQEDIRRKKLERDGFTCESVKIAESSDFINIASQKDMTPCDKENSSAKIEGDSILASDITDKEVEDRNKCKNSGSAELTSILKSTKRQERKKVEFDPIPVTNEFVKGREIRKRKKPKKEKLHLRVISKCEWLSLKAEYIFKQKYHMAALKKSLRQLRQQENQGKLQGHKRVDLEDVFGTKRLKPSQDLKMAHVESLKFTPNVIVQWKCSHDMHRDKIRTMFKEMSGDSIAYIDAKEEAKFGYIRFKNESSAEEFTKLSRHSGSFYARILPADQQEDYWKRANEDRMKKLGRKKHEKGSEKIARKVFERNKAIFFQKPSHVVFGDDDEDITNNIKGLEKITSNSESQSDRSHSQDGDQLPVSMDTQVIKS